MSNCIAVELTPLDLQGADDAPKPPYDWRYMAGLVDGEGTVTICRERRKNDRFEYYLRIKIEMTSQRTVEGVQGTFRGNLTYYKPRKKNYKPTVAWTVKRKHAKEFLLHVLPYLTVKRAEAVFALKYQEKAEEQAAAWHRYPVEVLQWRDEMYLKMRALKLVA